MSLAEDIQAQVDRHKQACEGRGPMWAVHFDAPIHGVYVEAQKGLPALLACLIEMRRPWGKPREVAGRPDLIFVPLKMLEHFCVPETFMQGLMAALRQSNLHGYYYKLPEVDKEYITGEETYERKEYRF